MFQCRGHGGQVLINEDLGAFNCCMFSKVFAVVTQIRKLRMFLGSDADHLPKRAILTPTQEASLL